LQPNKHTVDTGGEIMTVSTALEEGARRVVDLLACVEQAGNRDRVVDVIDAVTLQLACERTALRALSARGDGHTHVHALAHARARSALFRLATSPHGSRAFRMAVGELLAAFSKRPCGLVRALSARLGARERASLAEQMIALAEQLDHPRAPAREVARAVERCERSLDFSARLGVA
jgi:hypothetical protein